MMELKEAVRKTKVARAPGANEVVPEMIKSMGQRGEEEFLKTVNLCWKQKEVSNEWKMGETVPTYI